MFGIKRRVIMFTKRFFQDLQGFVWYVKYYKSRTKEYYIIQVDGSFIGFGTLVPSKTLSGFFPDREIVLSQQEKDELLR